MPKQGRGGGGGGERVSVAMGLRLKCVFWWWNQFVKIIDIVKGK